MKVINFIFRVLALVGLIIVVSAIVRWLTINHVLEAWESHMPDQSIPVDGEISSSEAMAQLRALVMFGNVIAHLFWRRAMEPRDDDLDDYRCSVNVFLVLYSSEEMSMRGGTRGDARV